MNTSLPIPPAILEFAQLEATKAAAALAAVQRVADDVNRYLRDSSGPSADDLLAVCRIVDSYLDGYAHADVLARSTVADLEA